MTPRPWTITELTWFRENYPKIGDECASVLNRSVTAIRQAAHRYGVKRIQREPVEGPAPTPAPVPVSPAVRVSDFIQPPSMARRMGTK